MMMKRDFIEVYDRLKDLNNEFLEKQELKYEEGKFKKAIDDKLEYIIHESATIICSKIELENIFFKGRSDRYRAKYKLTSIYEATNYKAYITDYLWQLKKHIITLNKLPVY